MSEQHLGLRIRNDFARVSNVLAHEAGGIPVAVIGDAAHRLFSLHAGFHNYSLVTDRFSGSALTVKVRPGDNLFLHKAVDIAKPGDVIVVDAGGALENAIIGDLLALHAVARGVVAFVIDGAIRDVEGVEKLPIPVYARGVTPNGPWKSGPGQIGYPITVGGAAVAAGDLVVGDRDGVIVVPGADVQAVLAKAKAQHQLEALWVKQISEGAWPREWVDQAIAKIQ